MKRAWQFLRANCGWLLAVPPLLLFGIAVHVTAWYVATLLTGGRIDELRVMPRGLPNGDVSFGEMVAYQDNPVLVAIAPLRAWLAIAGASTLFFAWRGRSRWIFLDQLVFIATLVLPIVASVLELSHVFTGWGFDGSVLQDQRTLVTVSASPVILILIAMSHPRFHALFRPKLRVATYCVGWFVVLFSTVFIRHADLVPRIYRALRTNAAASSPAVSRAPPIRAHDSRRTVRYDACDDCGELDNSVDHVLPPHDPRLSKYEIVDGMSKIRGKVAACYETYKVPGLANLAVTVEPNGRVSRASVAGSFSGTPTGECVESAVKSARFRVTKKAMTFAYPFMLR